MKYIKSLDAIRAFAVIIVVVWHWWHPINPVRNLFIPGGEFGVTLFFVLSGYLITSILLKAKQGNKGTLEIIKNFIIRRALRIFPLYYAFIAVLILIQFPFGKGHLVYFLTYTSNFLSIKERSWNTFSHTWSLSVEEQFYLIWPWLILLIKDKYLKYLFISSILIAVFSVFFSIKILHIHFDPIFTSSCFDAFGIGGAYAYASLNEDRLKKFIRYLRLFLPLALLIYFAEKIVPFFGIFPLTMSFDRTTDSIISVWLIHLAITNKSIWIKNKILENKFINLIGKMSYGIYLIHYPFPGIFYNCVNMLVNKFPRLKFLFSSHFFNTLFMCFALFFICYLSFEFFERRVTGFKRKFNY